MFFFAPSPKFLAKIFTLLHNFALRKFKENAMNDFFHFLANNFRKAKDGDRFFFTHTNQQGSFTRAARKKNQEQPEVFP